MLPACYYFSKFDMIIGNTFLTAFRAVLEYYTSNCALERHGKTYALRPLSYSVANFDSPYCAHTTVSTCSLC